MYKNSWLMIHKPWTELYGDANELRKAADILDVLQKGLEETYCLKVQGHMSYNDVHQMVEDETWLTGAVAAEKFKIKLLESNRLMNCVGSREKLKSMGVKNIPSSINFYSAEHDDLSEIELALAISKGVIV